MSPGWDASSGSWTDIDGSRPGYGLPDLRVNDLVVNPANGHIYVAGADSVYASSDGGATWVRLDGQIPRVRMVQIALAPVTGHLVVATYGRGDWETAAP